MYKCTVLALKNSNLLYIQCIAASHAIVLSAIRGYCKGSPTALVTNSHVELVGDPNKLSGLVDSVETLRCALGYEGAGANAACVVNSTNTNEGYWRLDTQINCSCMRWPHKSLHLTRSLLSSAFLVIAEHNTRVSRNSLISL